MAEILRAIPSTSVDVSITDGTNTHSLSSQVLGDVTFSLRLPRRRETIMTQSGGQAAIYGHVDMGTTGPGTLKYTFIARDLTNTTDVTSVDLHQKLYANQLPSGWTSTNPLVDTQQNMLDFKLTFKDAKGTGTDATLTAAGVVTEMADKMVNGVLAYDITVAFFEEWARA